MGGTLIRKISSIAAAAYGVNIFEQPQPPTVKGRSTRAIGMVADLPWGPVNVITTVTTTGQFLATFCPLVFAAANSYPAMRALLNKPFPGGIKVCRIEATGSDTAAKTFNDDDPAASVDVTANYPGELGNRIEIEWSANADDATARDATVTIADTAYSAFYENVATMVDGSLVVTDPGDPFCTFAKNAAGNEVPAVASAAALEGGDDGTAVAGDYVGSEESIVGIQKFYADSVKVAALFVAECPEDLVDDVNDGLEAYALTADKGMTILCTPPGLTRQEAEDYAADYRDDRIVFPYPMVKTTNFFDPAVSEITVDGNAFAASAIASCDPWISPGASGGKAALKLITGLENEDLTAGDYDLLEAAGVAAFMIEDTLGPIMRPGITTSLDLPKIRRRRTADYLTESIAAFLVQYVETPNDLDLENQTLGENTGAEVGAISAFLKGEVTANHIAAASVDPYGSNTEEAMDGETFTIAISAETFADQDRIILSASIGDSVTVSE